ncbi:DNA translocase ftsK, partial [Daphnia magna]
SGAAQCAAPDHSLVRDSGLPGLCRCQLAADHGPGQGHRRPARGGRPGQDAALPGGRYHRFGQVGRHQRHDPVLALQGRGARCAPDPDRPQDAGNERLRRHPASAGARGDGHEAGQQRA